MNWAAALTLFASGLSMWAGTSEAAHPFTLADLCAGYTISKRGNDVLIRCPGDPVATPWMTFKDCSNPKVQRTGADKASISCTFRAAVVVAPAKPESGGK